MSSDSPLLNKPKTYSLRTYLTFLIPSLLGVFLFMLPIKYEGSYTIPVAILAKLLNGFIGDYNTLLVFLVIVFISVLSIFYRIYQPKSIRQSDFLHSLLSPSWSWFTVRILGGLFIVMTYLHIGPEFIWAESTGGLVLNGLLPTLLSVFIFAGLFLPLLLNFGLLELVGTLLSKIMRPAFNLPGRSAIDCLASWLGDGSVGILLTSKQYEDKKYTQKEAVIVATTFSAVSITFSLVVLAQVKLEAFFLPFYGAVCLAGLVAAIVLPRLPPLRGKKNTYIDGSKPSEEDELIPNNYSAFSWGYSLALKKANQIPSVSKIIQEGCKNAIDMVFGVLPIVMALGTLALIIAEYTQLFSILGKPFVFYLELLNVPDAAAASTTMMVGFADMFLPSVIAAPIASDMTRFIIAALSVTQLIYMSEVGALILGSKIPVNILELFMIFILRTLITLPVIVGVAHLVF